jgi:putative flippase GtrA|tara:strand:- start:174 stop:587 length:414 start_codon:yes stop_codon:yes gene_type:complete
MAIFRKFSFYLVGQLLAYVLDYGVFVLLFEFLNVNELWANLASKTAAGSFAFFFHAFISFRGHDISRMRQSAIRYVLVVLSNMILSTLLLWGLTVLTPISPLILKIFTDVVLVGLTFFLVGNVVFPKPKPESEAEAG